MNVRESSQNSVSIESNLTMPCAKYIWGSYNDYNFEKHLFTFYEKIAFWKKNLFLLLLPGEAARKFLEEVSRLMNECLQDWPLKDIAFKAIMVMPNRLLQEPSQNSKSKDHLSALARRMEFWESGKLMKLLKETETIQEYPRTTTTATTINKILKKFSNEIRTGNIHNAIKLLTDNMKNGILPLTEKKLQHLKQKHPPRCNPDLEVLLPDKPEEGHPIKFASINAEYDGKLHSKQEDKQGHQGLMLKVGRSCLHQLNLEHFC